MWRILQRTKANSFEGESIQRRDWLNSDQAIQTGSNRTCWYIQVYDTTSRITSYPEVIPGTGLGGFSETEAVGY